MKTATLPQRYTALSEEIKRHAYRYHVLGHSVISDREYDEMYNRLVALETAHPELVTTDSPTQRAWGVVI
jgi:NAD-dependent DNA ligase (contains BRCT domain type II)